MIKRLLGLTLFAMLAVAGCNGIGKTLSGGCVDLGDGNCNGSTGLPTLCSLFGSAEQGDLYVFNADWQDLPGASQHQALIATIQLAAPYLAEIGVRLDDPNECAWFTCAGTAKEAKDRAEAALGGPDPSLVGIRVASGYADLTFANLQPVHAAVASWQLPGYQCVARKNQATPDAGTDPYAGRVCGEAVDPSRGPSTYSCVPSSSAGSAAACCNPLRCWPLMMPAPGAEGYCCIDSLNAFAMPCTNSFQCCPGYCWEGTCTCVEDLDPCINDFDCCNAAPLAVGGGSKCINGSCQMVN